MSYVELHPRDAWPIFEQFCAFGKGASTAGRTGEMDSFSFVKMCRECIGFDKRFTKTDADLIFVKAKDRGQRRISFEQWTDIALPLIAKKKVPDRDLEQAIRAVLNVLMRSDGPLVNDVTATATGGGIYAKLTDVETYTGLHKHRNHPGLTAAAAPPRRDMYKGEQPPPPREDASGLEHAIGSMRLADPTRDPAPQPHARPRPARRAPRATGDAASARGMSEAAARIVDDLYPDRSPAAATHPPRDGQAPAAAGYHPGPPGGYGPSSHAGQGPPPRNEYGYGHPPHVGHWDSDRGGYGPPRVEYGRPSHAGHSDGAAYERPASGGHGGYGRRDLGPYGHEHVDHGAYGRPPHDGHVTRGGPPAHHGYGHPPPHGGRVDHDGYGHAYPSHGGHSDPSGYGHPPRDGSSGYGHPSHDHYAHAHGDHGHGHGGHGHGEGAPRGQYGGPAPPHGRALDAYGRPAPHRAPARTAAREPLARTGDRGSEPAQPPLRSPIRGPGSGASTGRRSFADSYSEDALFSVFLQFTTFGASKIQADAMLDSARWIKFLKDTGLLDRRVSRTDADLIFTRLRPKGERRIDFPTFKLALAEVGVRRHPRLNPEAATLEAFGQACERGVPSLTGTQAETDHVFSRLTDTKAYTGSHKHRFDASGRGRGLAGRESIVKGGTHGGSRYQGGKVSDLSQIVTRR